MSQKLLNQTGVDLAMELLKKLPGVSTKEQNIIINKWINNELLPPVIESLLENIDRPTNIDLIQPADEGEELLEVFSTMFDNEDSEHHDKKNIPSKETEDFLDNFECLIKKT
jgi:hypothetical protein